MMVGQNDFIVDWKGNCFICWEPIPIQLPSTGLDPESTNNSFPVYSLECLSRYLEIDMSKVFQSDGPNFPDLLAMVRKSKLKVGLCSECALVNSKLSELYAQLEKIEMQTVSCIQLLRSKLEKVEETKGAEIEMMTSRSDSFVEGKLQIVKSLRKETMQKCSRKLTKLLPKVRIQNLTLKELMEEKAKLISCSTALSSGNFLEEQGYISDMEHDTLQELEWKDEAADSDEHGNSSDFTQTRLVVLKSETNEKETLENSSLHLDSTPVFRKSVGRSGRARRKRTSNPKTAKPTKVKYRCKLCKHEFPNLFNYKRHHESVHMRIRYKCRKCERQFSQKGKLKLHLKNTVCGTGGSGG